MDQYASPFCDAFRGDQQRMLMTSSLESHVDEAVEAEMLDAMIATWREVSKIPPMIYGSDILPVMNTPN